NPPGSPSLITPTQAADVAAAMWGQWESALVASNTRAMSQLAAGPLLTGKIDECALPSGECVFEKSPRPIMELHTVVPLEQGYPLYFLSEIRTTQYVNTASGLTSLEPWIELQILVKQTEQASWRLRFDTGYNSGGNSPPTLFTFDFTPDGYNPAPTEPTPVPVGRFLPLLAAYWQSFKDKGRAPVPTPFVDDGYTSGVGKQFAEHRTGSVYAGHRDTFRFGADSQVGPWQFAVGGGFPFVCGAVRDIATFKPVGGLLDQSADESNYGIPLRPGRYRRIVTTADHLTCVFARGQALDAVGNDIYTPSVTGAFARRAPTTKHRALDDFETAFSVLAYQLGQYETKLRACAKTHAVLPCSKLYATRAEHELALFERRVRTDNLPARVQGRVASVTATARSLTRLFGRLANGRPTAALMLQVEFGLRQARIAVRRDCARAEHVNG
ncbi:MAG TPA: hypothetical protein VNR59_01335, partial [Gaiellaceae bacterium]|nr:hypothetical protein [Gaiellaceae bacterium]